MQDVLGLGGERRMNFPGQSEGWWEWRLQWSQVQHWHAQRLAESVPAVRPHAGSRTAT